MASTITMKNEVLASSFVESNKDSIKRYLKSLADNPMRSYEYLVQKDGRNISRRYVPIVSLLELIELSGKASLFKEELSTVHKSISIEALKKQLANISEESRFTTREHLKSRAIKDHLIEIRGAYISSGALIGKTIEQLENEIYPAQLDPNLIRAHDVLAVHILGLTPLSRPENPPQTIVLQAGIYPPVKGLPFTVNKEGNIQLPFLGDFHVAGKTPAQARDEIWTAYKKADVIEDGLDTQPDVAFLMYGGLEMEIRQIVGPSIELPRREEGKRNK